MNLFRVNNAAIFIVSLSVVVNRVKEFAPLSNREVFYNHKNGVKGRDREPIHYQTPHIVVSLLYMYMVTSLQTVDSVETLK